VLDQLLSLERTTTIPGAINGLVKANAGLKAAKSMSEPTRNVDNLVAVFI
jgi:UDP-N-acetylenolpyruvoylglucosamine reductase